MKGPTRSDRGKRAGGPEMTGGANRPNLLLIVALALSAGIALWGLIDPRGLGQMAARAVATQFDSLGWFIMLEASGLLIFALFLMLSPFGKIRRGPDDARPEFSTTSWIAMLFAAGMGVGRCHR